MKNKSLILITASLIIVAAILLTAGLSLLHGSAFEATEDEVAIDEVIENVADESVGEVLATEDEEKLPENDMPSTEDEPEVIPEVIPENKPLVKPENISYENDVIIQIYEHETGKLVGQVEYTEDEVYEAIQQEHAEIFGFFGCDFATCIYDPTEQIGQAEDPICLPYGKYRIEVYAVWYADNNGAGILQFAYTYGDRDILEWFADGLLFSGCEDFIDMVDSLIAVEMDKIESGNPEIPTREEDITVILGFGKNWNGTSWNWTGDRNAIFDRGTPRFPYIKD